MEPGEQINLMEPNKLVVGELDLEDLDELKDSNDPGELGRHIDTVGPLELDELVQSDEPVGRKLKKVNEMQSDEPVGWKLEMDKAMQSDKPVGKKLQKNEDMQSDEPVERKLEKDEDMQSDEPVGRKLEKEEVVQSNEPGNNKLEMDEAVQYDEPVILSVPPKVYLRLNKKVRFIESVELDKPVESKESLELDKQEEQKELVELSDLVDPVKLGTPMKYDELMRSFAALHFDDSFESSDSLIWTNNASYKFYTTAVKHLIQNLQGWRVKLEETKYCHINFDEPLPFWTRKDKKIVRKEIYDISYDLRKQKIIDKMHQLNKTVRNKCDSKLFNQLMTLMIHDIYLLSVTPWADIMFPLSMDNIYDWDRVSKAVEGRHTPGECQELWHTKLHSSVRNKSWSKAETLALADLAVQYNLNNWDGIALKLNTNRSGSQCFMQYRRYLHIN